MPFVHDQTQDEWLDDETEPPPPRVDQFVYIAASEFGGGRAPVRFDVPPFQPPVQAAAAEQPSQPQPVATAERRPESNGGVWQSLRRLLGGPRSAAAPSPAQASHQANGERARREWAQRWERIRAIVIPALQQIGGRRIYCRYDGGNDEGFAWFDSLELQDGRRIDLGALTERLHDAGVHAILRSAGVELKDPFSRSAVGDELERGALKDFVDMVCHDFATMLLGQSFGTGEFSMFGAFTVDLEARIISDDPRADPVVQNISIGR